MVLKWAPTLAAVLLAEVQSLIEYRNAESEEAQALIAVRRIDSCSWTTKEVLRSENAMGRKNSSLRGRMVLTFFMLLLLCIGGGLLLGASSEFMESLEAMSWPTVVGKVTRSELKVETQKIKTRSSDGIRRSASEDIFIPMINYTFEIDGKEHQGTRVSAVRGGTLGDRASVEAKLRKYQSDNR